MELGGGKWGEVELEMEMKSGSGAKGIWFGGSGIEVKAGMYKVDNSPPWRGRGN